MTRRGYSIVDAAVPVLVAGVITVGTTAGGGAEPVPLLLGCGAGLSLLGRRRAPATTLAVSGALTLVLLLIEPDAGATTVIAPALALYSLALRLGTRAKLAAAAAAMAGIVLVDSFHRGGPTLPQTLAHALLVAIPLLIADLHRARHANLELAERTREQEAERRVEQERLRIARDLHDVVAHTLTTINVQASTAAELLERSPQHARVALETIEHASRDAIDEMRAILGVLRNGEEADTPLSPAPGIDDVAELVRQAQDEGVDVQIEVDGDRPERIPEAVSLAAYRIVQESLTNARRHAAGAAINVTVSFRWPRLALAVENARGVPRHGNGRAPGVGILGMRERAAAAGGTLTAEPLPGGFRVEAELPYAGS